MGFEAMRPKMHQNTLKTQAFDQQVPKHTTKIKQIFQEQFPLKSDDQGCHFYALLLHVDLSVSPPRNLRFRKQNLAVFWATLHFVIKNVTKKYKFTPALKWALDERLLIPLQAARWRHTLLHEVLICIIKDALFSIVTKNF